MGGGVEMHNVWLKKYSAFIVALARSSAFGISSSSCCSESQKLFVKYKESWRRFFP